MTLRLLAAFTAALLLVGCGYRPTVHYTKKVLGQKIYTTISIPVEDPESSLLIIDAINEAVVSKFQSSLCDSKTEADTILEIKTAAFSTSGLQKDDKGYTVLYRTTSTLGIVLKTKKLTRTFKVSGIYDFAVTSDSLVSEEKRLESFRLATLKALDEVTPVLAAMGNE